MTIWGTIYYKVANLDALLTDKRNHELFEILSNIDKSLFVGNGKIGFLLKPITMLLIMGECLL